MWKSCFCIQKGGKVKGMSKSMNFRILGSCAQDSHLSQTFYTNSLLIFWSEHQEPEFWQSDWLEIQKLYPYSNLRCYLIFTQHKFTLYIAKIVIIKLHDNYFYFSYHSLSYFSYALYLISLITLCIVNFF